MKTQIKYSVLDVDGTLTNGKIYIGPSGEIMNAFNAIDGYAVGQLMPEAGIEPVIITGRSLDIVRFRAKELKSVAVMGDDLNDLSMMQAVKDAGGLVGSP